MGAAGHPNATRIGIHDPPGDRPSRRPRHHITATADLTAYDTRHTPRNAPAQRAGVPRWEHTMSDTIPRPTPKNEPPMVTRTVRVPTPLWADASAVAAAEGLSVSDVVRHYLQHYVDTAPTAPKKKGGRKR